MAAEGTLREGRSFRTARRWKQIRTLPTGRGPHWRYAHKAYEPNAFILINFCGALKIKTSSISRSNAPKIDPDPSSIFSVPSFQKGSNLTR
jgi:hypothetical protein